MFPVLLVEDKDSLRGMLRHALEAQGHFVLEARDEPEALHHLQQSRPAVVLTDLKLPTGDGFGVLRAAKELDPELQVVVMTAFGSIQDAVTAMKQGAMDFLAKPVDPDHLNLMVERAIAQRRMLSEYVLLKEELAQRRGAPRIIGEDPQLRQVSQQLHRAAADGRHRAPRRRERHRQGTLRARAARAEPARGWSVCRHQLRRDPRHAARDRVVRPRKGRIYRRRRPQAGPVRDGAPRHAVPRRDRRSAARAAGQDPARARGPSSSSGWAAPARFTSTRASSRRRTASSRRVWPRASSARTCISGCRCSRSRSRRCASAARDIPMLARHFVEKFCRDLNKQALLLSPGGARRAARAIRGPATCASCRTASSARSSCATATRSSRGISTCRSAIRPTRLCRRRSGRRSAARRRTAIRSRRSICRGR